MGAGEAGETAGHDMNDNYAPPTRQLRRAIARETAWDLWRIKHDERGNLIQAPTDDRGVLRRRVRRSIALSLARRVGK